MPTINKPKKIEKRSDQYDKERTKIYNSKRWVRLRAWKFVNSPLCEECLKEGKVTPTDDIHHIISFMSTDDKSRRLWLAYDYDNLMSLCKQCHQKIHNQKNK